MEHADHHPEDDSIGADIRAYLSKFGEGSSRDPARTDAMERVAEAATHQFLSDLREAEPVIQNPQDDNEFSEMMVDLRSGSIAAVWLVIERYEPHIRRVISRTLFTRLRSRFDTMDFVQMVWKSLFEEPHRIYALDSPARLGAYLTKMAEQKVLLEYRRHTTTQKHDISREQPFDSQQIYSPHETPSQLAIARERWDQLLDGLPEHHREIVRLRLEGRTFTEIGDQLEIHERTARQVLSQVTARLANASESA